jgi:hypothetical protein
MSRNLEQAKIELEILRIIDRRSPQAVERSNLLGNATRQGELELTLDSGQPHSLAQAAQLSPSRLRGRHSVQ